ncbi:MAG: gliding motility protein GldN [Vicingaceae bacterium]|jgi:gliding motility associated protien GldN|nr:gliding motility protein GldN [Flavobacteriales bacterium]MBQ19452.1 gliding motility protein GldN [Flavobacteriales bacterium]MDF1674563.1 gliding motility protein GldN [Vicingaceae bacterium]|tara:strand:+ start:157683 stop:158528 length:846 start_codon:yes stop_codon:yes gene_type:complete
MKLIKIGTLLLVGVLLTAGLSLSAQDLKVLDKPWVKENTPTRRVIPYTHVREQDVMWHRRIWREIDLREKINHPLYYPTTKIDDRKSLFDVIKDAVLAGELSSYDPSDDEFKIKLTPSEAMAKMGDTISVLVEDPETFELVETNTYQEISSVDVVKYHIKEDWFFDRERSIMDVRIMGIAPLVSVLDENGQFKGLKSLFWIYFPEARYVFANYDVFNRQNDAERRTFEDIFWKRMFNSYIIKRSNVYDRMLIDYKMGIDRLLEAEQVKEEIFNMEHDVWHF